MSRKQDRYRPAGKLAHQHQNQVVAKANIQGTVPQEDARRVGGFPLSKPKRRNRYLALAVCVFLLLAVGLVFGQTTGYQFVNFDDGCYVYDNPQISGGFSVRAVAWVFTHEHGANWHPFTGLSHLLDCQLFGLHAGAHHLTNVLLHAATAVALFVVLWQMTGALWPSALVAGLFAVHPLRVESVAWIAERKDVLSGLMFVLSLAAYVRYVQSPFSLGRYLLLAVVFALGLMAKPMLVTLPAVLLLLDYWPLGRFPFRWQLVMEKLPLVLLAALSCLTTLWAQGSAAALNRYLPLGARISNALVAYVAYLVQLFWPAGLAVYYPHPEGDLPAWKVFGSLVVLACLSLGALAYRRRYPYLLVGWLWYVGMLAPVSGVVVQAGGHAMADRFTYLPQIGLYIALAWGAVEVCRSWPYRRGLCGVGSALVLMALMGGAWRQTSFWRDSETLWTHTLACTSQNWLAHTNIGLALALRGQLDEAMAQYRKAIEIKPDYAKAYYDLGNNLAQQGQLDKAMAQYRKAIEIKPDYAEPYNNLGINLTQRGQLDEAMAQYRKAIEIKPDYAEPYYNLGNNLAQRVQLDEAMAQYRKAIEIKPDYAEAYYNLGNSLAQRGQFDEAMAQYRKALEIKPDLAEAYYNLGINFARRGQLDEAMAQFRKALKIKPNYAEAYYNLGINFARRGQLDEAMAQYRKAIEIKPDFANAYNDLGIILARRGQFDEAIAAFQKALKIRPNYADAHNNLGNALTLRGRAGEAMAHYRKVVEIKPDSAQAHNRLAWLQATSPEAMLRNGAEAIEHALRADQLCGGTRPEVLNTLAAAYAEAGRFPEALAAARKGVELATQQNNHALVDVLRARITLYEAGKPYRQTPSTPGR